VIQCGERRHRGKGKRGSAGADRARAGTARVAEADGQASARLPECIISASAVRPGTA
jgi:hypothetical protein